MPFGNFIGWSSGKGNKNHGEARTPKARSHQIPKDIQMVMEKSNDIMFAIGIERRKTKDN
jgi:hypothetical protein